MKNILSTSFLIITLITLSSTVLNAQTNNVYINVKNTDYENLMGVEIMAKGTQIGGITDHDGSYIFICPPNTVLEVSFVGYIKQEINVADKTVIYVTLEKDNTLSFATYNFIDLNNNRFINFNYCCGLFINERKSYIFKNI